MARRSSRDRPWPGVSTRPEILRVLDVAAIHHPPPTLAAWGYVVLRVTDRRVRREPNTVFTWLRGVLALRARRPLRAVI